MFRLIRIPQIQPTVTTKILTNRLFHTSTCLRSITNPVSTDESFKIKLRKPGKMWSEPLDPKKQLSMRPIYEAPAGHHIAFTKRATFGFLFIGLYAGYVTLTAATLPNILGLVGILPIAVPIPLLHYLTKHYVTRVFRLYDKDVVQTYDNITKDETLVIEKISTFGRSLHATEIKLKDIKLANGRYGWVNWVAKDEASGEVIPMYIADNVGGIKMDRLWGIVEKNSGVDNGRGFLDEKPKNSE